MKRLIIKGVLFALFFISTNLHASFVLENDKILNQEVVSKIDEMGAEIFSKSGVNVYVATVETLGEDTIKEFGLKILKSLENPDNPTILLILAKQEHKVEILETQNAKNLIKKDEILSASSHGSIIPILVSQKKDVYNAAILNGYAEICDEIANTKKFEFSGSIGNTNRIFLNALRYIFYAILIFAGINYLRKRKNG